MGVVQVRVDHFRLQFCGTDKTILVISATLIYNLIFVAIYLSKYISCAPLTNSTVNKTFCGATCINWKFGATSISWNFGHQVAPLAFPPSPHLASSTYYGVLWSIKLPVTSVVFIRYLDLHVGHLVNFHVHHPHHHL